MLLGILNILIDMYGGQEDYHTNVQKRKKAGK